MIYVKIIVHEVGIKSWQCSLSYTIALHSITFNQRCKFTHWHLQQFVQAECKCKINSSTGALNFSVLFQLNARNVFNTHIYHQLRPICFDVCYTIFRETIALFAQELYAFCNVVTLPSTQRQRKNIVTGAGSSQNLHATTDPNTAGWSEYVLPTYIINSRNQQILMCGNKAFN